MVWVERELKDHPPGSNSCARGRAATQQLRLPRAPSRLALNAPRVGAPTASLESPCQGLTALYVKNFCLTSYLNLRLFVSQSVVTYPRGRQEAWAKLRAAALLPREDFAQTAHSCEPCPGPTSVVWRRHLSLAHLSLALCPLPPRNTPWWARCVSPLAA